jgi:hypothetical protein
MEDYKVLATFLKRGGFHMYVEGNYDVLDDQVAQVLYILFNEELADRRIAALTELATHIEAESN